MTTGCCRNLKLMSKLPSLTGREIIPEVVSISMIREELSSIPNYDLPPSFSCKWYTLGDEQDWVKIQQSADRYNHIDLNLFKQQFEDDPQTLAQRQCFILNAQEQPIGTATAWFDLNYRGQEYGRVHWVAIIPEMQGQGLAKPLMSLTCQRLCELGHNRAYLTTAPERIIAIDLYLKFGFIPQVRNDDELSTWKTLEQRLGKSILNLTNSGEI